jgi:hypothetical protein
VVTYDDSDRSGRMDGIEGTISGVTVTLFDGHQIVGTQTSNALAGQVCFESLDPGPFQVFQTVPPNRQMTTADQVAVDLESGQNVVVLFGSVASVPPSEIAAVTSVPGPTTAPDSPAVEEPSTEPADASLAEKLFAVSGIVVLLVAAVLVGIFFIYRNR